MKSVVRREPFSNPIIKRLPALVSALGLLAVTACGGDFDSGLGFSVGKHADLNIAVAGTKVPGDEPYVGIRHARNPKCLVGTVLPFMDISPKKYFENVSNEVMADGAIPFLEKKPELQTKGRVVFAAVSAYDEAAKKYIPSYAAAFRAKGKLWIAWVQMKCPEPEYAELARSVITSLRPH